MTIGFYYHINICRKGPALHMPGYLGLFLDAVAEQTEQLVLFMHEATAAEQASCTYALKAQNVQWVNLGPKQAAWRRALWGDRFLVPFRAQAAACDIMLVRAPSPLAPSFFATFGAQVPIAYLLVGDYVSSTWHARLPLHRKLAILAMSVYLDWRMTRYARRCCMLSNSHEIIDDFHPYTRAMYYLPTATIKKAEIATETPAFTAPYRLVFAGRFDFAKGIRELYEAFAILRQKGHPVELHLAGWEDGEEKPVLQWMENKAKSLQLEPFIVNHGKLAHGQDMNALYRTAQVCIMPSYQEGFPRVLWEAMANRVPVVATTVGSIPYTLQHEETALLVPPKNAASIADAVERLLQDQNLREKFINNGVVISTANTLETQSLRLVNILKRYRQNWCPARVPGRNRDKILFIGSFLSWDTGTKGVAEKLEGYFKLHTDFYPAMVSRQYAPVIRAIHILLYSLFMPYKLAHIDVFSGNAFQYARWAGRIFAWRKKPYILTLRGGKLAEFYPGHAAQIGTLFQNARHIQTPSLFLQDFFSAKGWPVAYLPNPIQTGIFQAPDAAVPRKPHELLWVRAFSAIYQPHLPVLILKALEKDYPEATLTMIGPDKGLLNDTWQLIQQLGLSEKVQLPGALPNELLPEYYQTHGVFLNTTQYESFGAAVLEAAACGIPVVSGKVGEIPLLWTADQEILLADALEPEAFVQQVRRLFDHPDLGRRLSENALMKVQKFDFQYISEQWNTLFTHIARHDEHSGN